MRSISTTVTLAALFHFAAARLEVGSNDEIRASASTIADDLVSIYEDVKIPGLLDQKIGKDKEDDYQFWQSGAFIGSLIDYYRLTGDDSHNDLVREALMHQSGDDFKFTPLNQTLDMTTAAQCMWGLSALQAAEENLEEPPDDEPSWIDRASNVFDNLADRVDNKSCGGGLRQGVGPFQRLEWDEKDALSNGCFMTLGARLSVYTSNATFGRQATKTFEWLEDVGLIDHSSWLVNEKVSTGCSDIDDDEWSINSAIVLYGAAAMSNLTKGANMLWRSRTNELLDMILANYVNEGLVYETTCEEWYGQCDTEMKAYKSLVFRWLGAVSQLAPYTAGRINPVLEMSGETAAKNCKNGDSGVNCEFNWQSSESYAAGPRRDDPKGVSAKMTALDAVTGLLVNGVRTESDDTGSGSGGDRTNTGEDEAASTDEPSAAGRVVSDAIVAVGAAMFVLDMI